MDKTADYVLYLAQLCTGSNPVRRLILLSHTTIIRDVFLITNKPRSKACMFSSRDPRGGFKGGGGHMHPAIG